MHTLLVSRNEWHHLLTCIAVVALFLSSCASGPPPIPPTPSKELRSQLKKIQVSDCKIQPEVDISKPFGAGEGASKGFGFGLLAGLEGLQLGPVVVIYAPISAVRGIVKGIESSQPKAKVEEFDKKIRATIQELNVPETLRQKVAAVIRWRKASEITGPSDQAASIIMEVVVTKINLGDSEWWTTPHRLFITERTRLIRATDGKELYNNSFGTGGQAYTFDEWFAMDAAKIRKEVEGICHDLALWIVDDIFFAVRMEGQKEKFNEYIEVDP